MRVARLAVAVALLAPTLSCQAQGEDAATSRQADLEALRAQTAAFEDAIVAMDFDAAAATMSEDAIIMVPNQSQIVGRQAWVEFAESFNMTELIRYELEIDEMEARGDLAFLRTTYDEAFVMEGMEEPFSDRGKGLQIWRKESDGIWRLAIDCWNSNLPLPMAEGMN